MSCPEMIFYEISEHFRERIRVNEELLRHLQSVLQAASDHSAFLNMLSSPSLIQRLKAWYWRRRFARAAKEVSARRNELVQLRVLQAEFRIGQYPNVARYFVDQADALNGSWTRTPDSVLEMLHLDPETDILREQAARYHEFSRWLKPGAPTAA